MEHSKQFKLNMATAVVKSYCSLKSVGGNSLTSSAYMIFMAGWHFPGKKMHVSSEPKHTWWAPNETSYDITCMRISGVFPGT